MRLETFFFLFAIFFFKKWTIYSYKERKSGKKNAAAQLALILATRWTGNILFFMDSLMKRLSESTELKAVVTFNESIPTEEKGECRKVHCIGGLHYGTITQKY